MPPQESQSQPQPGNRPALPPGYYDVDAPPAQSARPAPPAGYYDVDAPPETKHPPSDAGWKIEAPATRPDFSKQPEQAMAYAEQHEGPIGRYLTQAETLTESGKKEHPVQAFIGKTAKGLSDYGKIIVGMAPLLGGPGEGPLGVDLGPTYRAPVEGNTPEGPAAAQAFTPLNRTPPNAAGKVEQVGSRPMNPEQAVIVPRAPGRTIGDRALPAAPAPPNPRIRAGVAGPTAETPKEAYAAATPRESTARQVGKLVNQAFGIEPLKPNVPLREQLPGRGATAIGKTAALPAEEELSDAIRASGQDPLFADRRARQLLEAANGKEGYSGPERRSAPTLIQNYMGPERRGVGKTEEFAESTVGAKQVKPIKASESETSIAQLQPETPKSALETKYPDKAVRQMVHANGEKIVQAIGKDPETLRAVHDLTRVDLRNALINSGEDMGQMTVSNSKFAGSGSISREEAFNRLLAKGHNPREIVDLAKKQITQP
jgi:hypothetical protein